MNLKDLHSNACLLCSKAYSATKEEIVEAGNLFAIEDYLVGVSWGREIEVCPSCIRKRFAKIRQEQDAFLVEMEKAETNKRLQRYYGPKKTILTICPNCDKKAIDPYDPEECGECGYDLVKWIDDPRQVRHRERHRKKEAQYLYHLKKA